MSKLREQIQENIDSAVEILNSIVRDYDLYLPTEAARQLITFIVLSQIKTSLFLIGNYKGNEKELLKEVNLLLDEYETRKVQK